MSFSQLNFVPWSQPAQPMASPARSSLPPWYGIRREMTSWSNPGGFWRRTPPPTAEWSRQAWHRWFSSSQLTGECSGNSRPRLGWVPAEPGMTKGGHWKLWREFTALLLTRREFWGLDLPFALKGLHKPLIDGLADLFRRQLLGRKVDVVISKESTISMFIPSVCSRQFWCTIKHSVLIEASIGSIFPAQNQYRFRHPGIVSRIGGTELKVLLNPCSDFISKLSPPNSIAISGLEKPGAALVDQWNEVFVQDMVSVMDLTQRTSVTCSPEAVVFGAWARLATRGNVRIVGLDTLEAHSGSGVGCYTLGPAHVSSVEARNRAAKLLDNIG